MSRKDYYAVGEIMTRKNGKKYECVEENDCDSCAFGGKETCSVVMCLPTRRLDAKEVHFILRKDLENK